MYNKNSNIQGRSLDVIKVIFHTIKEIIRSLFFFKRSSHLKGDAIEENHCLIQYSPLMCVTFSAFWLCRCVVNWNECIEGTKSMH